MTLENASVLKIRDVAEIVCLCGSLYVTALACLPVYMRENESKTEVEKERERLTVQS